MNNADAYNKLKKELEIAEQKAERRLQQLQRTVDKLNVQKALTERYKKYAAEFLLEIHEYCLLYTSPSPRDS